MLAQLFGIWELIDRLKPSGDQCLLFHLQFGTLLPALGPASGHLLTSFIFYTQKKKPPMTSTYFLSPVRY